MARTNRLAILCGIAVLPLGSGCDSFTPITYDVSILVKDKGGTVGVRDPKGSGTVKKRNAAGTSVTLVSDGQRIEVKVAVIKDDALVFDVSHPDYAVQQAEIARGESKDVYPGGTNVGVRIQVRCRLGKAVHGEAFAWSGTNAT